MIDDFKYDFRFPIVRKKRRLFYRIIQVVFFVSVIIFFIEIPFILDVKNGWVRTLLNLPCFLFLISGVIGIVYATIYRSFLLIGEALINKDLISIIIDNFKKECPINEVKNIVITFYAAEGDDIDSSFVLSSKDGTYNYLEFEVLDGKKYRYEFFVESDITLKHSLLAMEKHNIEFKLINKALINKKRSRGFWGS